MSEEPEAVGGEMEGAGLYTACHERNIAWILVKGICDWADGKKEEDRDNRQKLAAYNAAAFVLHALKHAALGRENSASIVNHISPSTKLNGTPSVISGDISALPPAYTVPMAFYPPLVMSVHGIRTRGEWQKIFASVISGSIMKLESFDYGHYGVLKFMITALNNRMIEKFHDWYYSVIKSCPNVDLDRFDKRPSLVAHSFGSWIVGNAMLKYNDMRFDKLIFAGSVLPRDFDWVPLFANDQVAFVRNECGEKGRVARMGRTASGARGSSGFDRF